MIEKLVKDDIESCLVVINEAFGGEYIEMARQELHLMFKEIQWLKPEFFVYKVNNEIVSLAGYSYTSLDYCTYSVFWICTLKNYRNAGYAAELIRHIIGVIKNEAFTSEHGPQDACIMLCCAGDKMPKYYSKFGFEISSSKDSKHIMSMWV